MDTSMPLQDWFQLISFPLELIGASLAFVEIYYPKKARILEDFLDDYPNILRKKLADIDFRTKTTAFLIDKKIKKIYSSYGEVILFFIAFPPPLFLLFQLNNH